MCCDHIGIKNDSKNILYILFFILDSMIPKKKGVKFEIHRGNVLDINANFDSNSFEIKEVFNDGSEGAHWISTLRSENYIKEKRKKFFVFFSSCGPHKVSLISSY